MEKIDARKLPSSAIEEKRFQAVKLRKQGMTRAEIGEIVGVNADTVGRWLVGRTVLKNFTVSAVAR